MNKELFKINVKTRFTKLPQHKSIWTVCKSKGMITQCCRRVCLISTDSEIYQWYPQIFRIHRYATDSSNIYCVRASPSTITRREISLCSSPKDEHLNGVRRCQVKATLGRNSKLYNRLYTLGIENKVRNRVTRYRTCLSEMGKKLRH